MGKIDDSIMENYRKALTEGNLSQASKAVKLAKSLKWLIETENFLDYEGLKEVSANVGNIFRPYSYRYNKDSGVVVFFRHMVNLTPTENRLLHLLSLNETYEENVRIIKSEEIKRHVWNGTVVSNSAVRILVKRLRVKIEPDPYRPQILLNFNKKGYIFVAKREM